MQRRVVGCGVGNVHSRNQVQKRQRSGCATVHVRNDHARTARLLDGETLVHQCVRSTIAEHDFACDFRRIKYRSGSRFHRGSSGIVSVVDCSKATLCPRCPHCWIPALRNGKSRILGINQIACDCIRERCAGIVSSADRHLPCAIAVVRTGGHSGCPWTSMNDSAGGGTTVSCSRGDKDAGIGCILVALPLIE